jgi:hypothetical protein
MRVDHRGADIFMSEELLDGTNIIARFTQVCGKRMPKRVAARRLADPHSPYGLFHCPLECELTGMMPTLNSGPRVHRMLRSGEDVLPRLLAIGMRVLSLQRIGHVCTAEPFLQIELMNPLRVGLFRSNAVMSGANGRRT